MKDYTVFQNVIIVMCECTETRLLAIAAINWNCIKSTLKCKTERFDRIASTQNVYANTYLFTLYSWHEDKVIFKKTITFKTIL